jgi:hypothetical protein
MTAHVTKDQVVLIFTDSKIRQITDVRMWILRVVNAVMCAGGVEVAGG